MESSIPQSRLPRLTSLVRDFRNRPVQSMWDLLAGLPGGKRLFSKAVGRAAPYSGSIGAHVDELHDGFARLTLRDRPAIRQHLGSVHAIALANLGELTTGLAMLYGFPEDARGIVTSFKIDYHKKARGLLTAQCTTEPITSSAEQEKELVAEIRDESGDLVATATAAWLIRPKLRNGAT